MTTSTHPTLVGAFRDRAMAERAMQALYDAGFQRDQIRYSGSGFVGGFFEGIKTLLVGPVASGGDIANDLTGMGLSEEEARYYANEYHNSHAIVAVKAPGREQEAMDIMHRFGSYEYSSMAGSQRPLAGSPEAPADDPLQPQQTPSNVPQQGYPLANVQPAQTATMADQPGTPAAPNRSDYQMRLQDVRAQLEETQRQLQDARTRLQAAKERETELQAVRKREAEYQETHKQLQDAQSQLQATLAELRETEARISQYNQ